ncbi:STAS domain-containing protein [Streptomyces sp. NBC_01571]|uniref:STAS domain-containing protein n=1 Tax=Streptomyces sp. NBC_01571 TaxID=2975883 RepID=UPI00225BE98E|nr:STAS domain-containing protein [Streptomyces sp. NBC_01571]MCX4578558.1 STAS domain-containing protein [Streptomyces sp. NBC_01571]
MTPPAGIELITTPSGDRTAVHLEVHGFLDYDCADHFLALASRQLTDNPDLRVLRLDCGHLGGLDSMGLAVLLMLHRRTNAAGVTLFLDNRRPTLERMLDITGALAHLIPDHADSPDVSAESQGMAYRHTSEGGTSVDRTSRPAGPEVGG